MAPSGATIRGLLAAAGADDPDHVGHLSASETMRHRTLRPWALLREPQA
jgi:hypothetical protein